MGGWAVYQSLLERLPAIEMSESLLVFVLTDASYFEQYIEGLGHVKSCPKYFDYLHDWCPPSLLDIAGLSNYYVQRAVEAGVCAAQCSLRVCNLMPNCLLQRI